MKHRIILLVALLLITTCYCHSNSFINKTIKIAKVQIDNEIQAIEKLDKFKSPITLNKDGSVFYANYKDWRSGFFPGEIWLMYNLTGDKKYLTIADKYSRAIEDAKNITFSHDVGFIIGSSFGNGYRITKNTNYKNIIIQAAKSLITRFRPNAGIIQSWEWSKKWKCPVIIDNMMNLEILFEATRLSGDSTYYRVAVSHANRTLKEHFRLDGSCFHVVDYDVSDGKVLARQTAQGYADWSSWSRGQAWAIYGFAMCYRETKNKAYLKQSIKTFHFIKNNPKMPKDFIPYWDMDAPKIPNEERDASSAAVIASALYMLYRLDPTHAMEYENYADKIMISLTSPEYMAKTGTNGNFLLMHSVGSKPSNSEVNVPLNYADYYFLEALKRKKDIENNKN